MADDDDTAPRYRAPALEKGLDILELLASSPGGLSLTTITQKLGRSMGEIYRIALALEARGYIRREANDDFALTLKMFELASAHPPLNRLIATALPDMQALADACQQSCHLAIVNNGLVVVVAQVDSPLAMRYSVRLGSRFPVLETSSGAVFVAFVAQPSVLQHAMKQTPEHARDAKKRIAMILRNGGERRASLMVDGVVNLSRPVFDLNGIAAVLTVPFLGQRGLPIDIDTAEDHLIAAARRITTALGGRIPSNDRRIEKVA